MKYSIVQAFVLGGAVLASASPATAAPSTACGAAITAMAKKNVYALGMRATVTTMRDSAGYTMFSMVDSYQVEQTPLHTSGARRAEMASLNRSGSEFDGAFQLVFPARGNGDEAGMRMKVNTDGRFFIRNTKYSTTYAQLESPVCYKGNGAQVVVTGQLTVGAGWTEFWSFVLNPLVLD